MSLAGPRKKINISQDPNNTSWARSTNSFGHKILTSQGWTPGSFLGARNVTHTDTFTVASASHIRVTLKDDTLGLGARRGITDHESTGLGAFRGLLERLNGKSESQLKEEQRQRDDVKLALYTQNKWQAIRFISGGFLMQEKNDATTGESDNMDVNRELPRKGWVKKLKGDSILAKNTTEFSGDISQDIFLPNRSKQATTEDCRPATRPKKKQEKTRKRRHSSDNTLRLDAQLDGCRSTSHTQHNKKSDSLLSSMATKTKEQVPMGRHVIRGRHIQQKKRALMDDKSLNEIFMVKN